MRDVFYQEAHKWYVDLSLPESELASDIVNYTHVADNPAPIWQEEDWGVDVAPTSYYQLKLSLDNVHMVDTESGFMAAVTNLMKVS